MLDGDHYKTHELVNQLMNNAVINSSLQLIEKLKPELSIVDDKYCYKLGPIVSYGNTLYEAVMDFDRAFYNQKIKL